MTYCWKISAYIEEKNAKGSLHRVFPVGNQDLVYEVMLRDKGGLGTSPNDITMECQLWLSENIQVHVHMQQAEVLPLSMLPCACCCWENQSSHDICVALLQEGGRTEHKVW